MKKMWKSTVVCAIVVVLSFVFALGSFAASPSPSPEEAVQCTADYLYGQLAGDITAYDGAVIVNLIRAGKDCGDFAAQLKEAETEALSEAPGSVTFAQQAINAAAVKLTGGEASLPEYTEDIELAAENPYTLCALLPLISEGGPLFGGESEALAADIIEALKRYYNSESEKGFDYYGYSADTNGLFYGALKSYEAQDSSLTPMLNAALGYMRSVESDAGYGFSEEFPEANASSTAGALTAFAAAGDTEACAKAYKSLMSFMSEEESGAFKYGETVSLFSTTDALRALLDYRTLLSSEPTQTQTQTPAPTPSGTPVNDVQNPETGASAGDSGTSVLVLAMATVAVAAVLYRRRRALCR